jgi:hypothetical protein
LADNDVKNAQDNYKTDRSTEEQVNQKRETIDGKVAVRNTMYTVAGIGLAGFAVTLFF